ncbi:MAG: AraC family transcriptional regulator [Pseudomonas sp.]|uniref:AraC family transcriptional regulator n=1 Tax=Pseudomonas sp. TaxID=306 RepID=UPI000CCA719D|nr:AraC family transcriptional regulator [Pseudomonas sp.]PJI49096.1 MAG: AraC family transcriptional regulator [Pseudomonas sp.]
MTALIRTTSFIGFPQLVAQLGGDCAQLLRRFEIDPQALDDDEARVPLRSLVGVLECAANELGCPDLGLRMAEHQDLQVLGPVALIARNSATVGQALEEISRFIGYHSPGIDVQLDRGDPDAPRLVIEIRLPGSTRLRQMQELALGVGYNTMKLLCGSQFSARSLLLSGAGSLPAARYLRYFKTAAYFSQDCNALVLSEEQLGRRIEQQDPQLHRVLLDYLRPFDAQASAGLVRQVENLILRTLPTQRCRISLIAEQLGLHERVLQRRLVDLGTGFEALLEQARRSCAERYLAERHMPMSQVAGLLGYSEQSVFNRACRRWFQDTPRAVRRQLLQRNDGSSPNGPPSHL